MSEIEILAAGVQEAPGIAGLAGGIWREHYIPILGRAQVDYMLDKFQSPEAICDQIRGGHLYFLIRSGNMDIGYFCVHSGEMPGEFCLSKLYIKKQARGKKAGKHAQEYIEGLARGRGFGKIVLFVNKQNTGAIRIYQKMGYRITDPVVRDIGNGFVMDDYRMEKVL